MIEDIYQAIESKIRSRFQDERLKIFDSFPKGKSMPDGASVFIETFDFEPSPLPDGRIIFETRWEIRHVVPYALFDGNQSKAKFAARDFSIRIATLLHDEFLIEGQAEPMKYLGSSDENYDKNIPDAEVWFSEFVLSLEAGENVWERFDSYYENILGTKPDSKQFEISDNLTPKEKA